MKCTKPVLCLLVLLLWGGTLFPASRRIASPFVSYDGYSLQRHASDVLSHDPPQPPYSRHPLDHAGREGRYADRAGQSAGYGQTPKQYMEEKGKTA